MEALPILVKSMERSSEEKTLLRNRIKRLRKAVSPKEKQLWDRQLKEQFFGQLPSFLEKAGKDPFKGGPADSIWIYLYLDIRNEAGTLPIIEELWKRGIRTAVPRVEGREITFYEIAGLEDVSTGCMGILEPVSGSKQAQAVRSLVVVPGVAFDSFGGRMGYGGGFYDRFFQREPDHPKWGLAYDFQMVEAVPQEPWDRKMDLVITPDGITTTGGKI